MESFWNLLKELTDPHSIISYGGLALLLFVVFAETGLFVGFFLPGDSLLFISGMICKTNPELLHTNIFVLTICLISAAVIGNIAGYWFGRKVGPALFKRNDSLFFKKKYVELTREFYNRHGGKTLILGRFLPIIRTFAPILAGVIKIELGVFMLYNIIGASAWAASLTFCGFFLGEIQWVRSHISYIVIFLITITTIPLLLTWKKTKKS